jgi:hypothetical protein
VQDDTAGGQSEDGMDDDQPRGQRPTTSSVEAFYRAMLPRFRRVSYLIHDPHDTNP